MSLSRLRTLLALALVCCFVLGADPSSQSDIAVTQAHIDAAVASIDAIEADIQHRSGVPGIAIAIVHNGSVIFAKGYGIRRIGTSEKVEPNTVFQVASVSKPIASSVVAAAVSDGKVRWTDPVAKYLPGFTLAEPWVGSHVTIADMFSHRSGLPDHAGDTLEDLGYTRAQILKKLALLPLDPFRITYNYTNFGLTAGAQAAANAEGTSWEALAREKIFQPLGMTHSSYRWIDYQNAANRATLHVGGGNTWKVSAREPDAQAPAGGLSSTVLDLAKWMIMELNLGTYEGRRIVGRDALLETWQPQILSAPPNDPVGRAGFYGLGFNVSYDEAGMLRLGHSGAFVMGAATVVDMLPAAKLGIVVLTNGPPTGVPESIAKMFFDRVEFGAPQRDWYAAYSQAFAKVYAPKGELVGKTPPAHPVASLALDAYAGRYANAYFGPATVRVKNGALEISLAVKPSVYRLTHWSGNVFSFEPTGEAAPGGPTAVTFVPEADGRGMTMTLEYLNENRLGTFTR
ncbi:MAG TPA: serine hydrolase [Candidatus Aquilonibacter sp.]